MIFIFIYFLRTNSALGGGGEGALPYFFFSFSVQQTTSGIGHRVNKVLVVFFGLATNAYSN